MRLTNDASYTIEEVSQLLKVSKLTVYDLIKKDQLPAYRVGRQMRIDAIDLERYKSKSKTGITKNKTVKEGKEKDHSIDDGHVIISGQDIVLDILAKHIENKKGQSPLRLYSGSLNSLFSMYRGECNVVSCHLFDGDTGEYNTSYVKKILVSQPFIQLNLVYRTAGIYVQKGNPLHIQGWADLGRSDVRIINREVGSGARVLLDEQLRVHGFNANKLNGYDHVLTSHYSVASAVASGQADIGIGIENVTKMVNVDFIPLISEQYDLIILKENEELVQLLKETVNSSSYKKEIEQLYGYDLGKCGEVIYES